MKKAIFPVAQTLLVLYQPDSLDLGRKRWKTKEDECWEKEGFFIRRSVALPSLSEIELTSGMSISSRTTTIGQSSNHWCFIKLNDGISLVVRCLRIHLPIQGTQVPFLVREGPICRGQLSPVSQLLSPCSRHHAPQQETPPQWDAHTQQLESSLCSLQLEKSCCTVLRIQLIQKKERKKIKYEVRVIKLFLKYMETLIGLWKCYLLKKIKCRENLIV